MENTTGTVAHNIRTALTAEGYTAKNLTEILPVSYSQATRLWNGKSGYRPEYIAKLARVLGMGQRQLIGAQTRKVTIRLTIKQAAEATNYCTDTIRKAIYNNELRSTQRNKGCKHLIEEIDLAAWLAGAR